MQTGISRVSGILWFYLILVLYESLPNKVFFSNIHFGLKMLSKRYIEDKPAERRWLSSLDRWLKKVHGYRVLSTGPLTPPPQGRQRLRTSSNENYPKQNNTTLTRCSSARPVIIVERVNRQNQNEFQVEQQLQPVINLNDHFIEVYYCTKTSHNYPGQLERYSRTNINKMCYCCDQCTACKKERNLRASGGLVGVRYNRHRPLNQTNSNKSFAQENVTLNSKLKISKLESYQSLSTL